MSPSRPDPMYQQVTPVPLENCMFPLYSTYPAIASPFLNFTAFGPHRTPGLKLYILTVTVFCLLSFFEKPATSMPSLAQTPPTATRAPIKIKNIREIYFNYRGWETIHG